MTPLVSVLMTAYNREKYIAEAIESVLTSTYTNFELIIVDDGSTDSTLEIAQRYQAKDQRIQVYRNEKNLGDYPNRNKAASYATGKYIKYLDSDDMIYQHSLEIMVQAMEKFPEAALGLSSNIIDELQAFPFLTTSRKAYFQHFLVAGFLTCGPSGSIINNDIFKQMGGFGFNTYVGSDNEFWLKVTALYPIVKFQPALVFWRQHEQQEFKEGNKTNAYLQRNFSMYMTILQSSDNPLSTEEKKEAIRLLKKRQLMNIVRTFLKGKVRLAASVFRKSELSIFDFFRCIAKNKFTFFAVIVTNSLFCNIVLS